MFDLFVKVVDGDKQLTTAGTITLWVLLGLILVIATMCVQKKGSKEIGTKQLVFCGIAMALALVTSYIEVFSFPFGGSVTLFSMLFVCMIGYFYGARVSIPVAIAYGLLQLVIKPYIYHPVQVLFDYPIAFGALGLSGFFSKSKHGLVKGYIIGIIGRWIFASVSGVVFFADYAWEGWNPIPYSLAYNGAYIFTEGIVTIIILSLPAVAKAIGQIKKMANEQNHSVMLNKQS
ncbi:MAG: energy-coupled thiamine transporter ThiT [Clostridiales bacterium]|nr:energy-coupled thiamine transporter ThiT [Clostridiales bacterium]